MGVKLFKFSIDSRGVKDVRSSISRIVKSRFGIAFGALRDHRAWNVLAEGEGQRWLCH